MAWIKKQTLPILKKFSLETATTKEELEKATGKLVEESHGIKKTFNTKRLENFVKVVEKKNTTNFSPQPEEYDRIEE